MNTYPPESASTSKQKQPQSPAANLRFQRRTSERAFYEGAFQPASGANASANANDTGVARAGAGARAADIKAGAGAGPATGPRSSMDYSAAITNDPDHPAGASPWASSPQHSRSAFGAPSNNDVPHDTFSQDHGQLDNGRPSTSTSDTMVPSENGDGPQSGYQPQQYGHHSQHENNSSPYQNQGQGQGQGQQHHQQQQQQQQQQAYQHQAYQQPQRYHPRGPNPQQQSYQQPTPKPATQYKLTAKITSLERTGRKDPIMRFDVYTNLPKFRTTQFRDVRRTHSEFQKFADHLISNNPEAMVPAVPSPVTSAGVGTDEDEARVKASMQRWLNLVCSSDVLMRDEEMVFFVESDFGYSPVVRRKQPATGVRRKYIKQFAPPPDDTPELLEARPVVKAFYLGTMDVGQKVDKVVKQRRALGLAESDFGVKIGQMNVQESHPGLANAYRKLGKVVQTVGDYHAAQGTAEATTMADPMQYHSSDAFIVKETLTNRHILLRELLQAQQSTRAKTTAANRLKASSSVKRDKVDEAIASLEEAQAHESYLQQKCQRVTENLVHDRRRWFARTATDLRAALREYVIRQIEHERRTLATLEQVRPDVRNVDASGGLSRLGREAHPVAPRRSSLASSQGPKGDAWSGVPRRPDGLNRSISGSFAGAVVPAVLPEDADAEDAAAVDAPVGASGGRARAISGASSLGRLEEDDEDRIDARNAASRLAQTTF